jgi:hypothetical protein
MVIYDMVVKSERIVEILPRGLVMLTTTVSIDDNEGTNFPVVIEESVVTVVGVLVKMTGDRSGDSTGVTTVMEDGTCNKGSEVTRTRR